MPKKQAKRKSKKVDNFAYETLHGASLVVSLLDVAMLSAEPLYEDYPELARKADLAAEALHNLYQEAGRVWSETSTKKRS